MRSQLEVSAKISADELEAIARADEKALRAIGDAEIVRFIVRAPKLRTLVVSRISHSMPP